MTLSVSDGADAGLSAQCPSCAARLVEIAGRSFRFQATPCAVHRPAAGSIRIGIDIAGRRISAEAEPTPEGAFEATLDIDYVTERLSQARLFIDVPTDGGRQAIAVACPPGDLFSGLQVDSLEAARTLVRRRRSRKHGFSAQIVAAYQSYLYGRDSGQLEVMAFSICSIGWRVIERERLMEPGAHAWFRARADELMAALRSHPDDHARWTPSLCTVVSQLSLAHGDVETALRYADIALSEPDIVERSPISSYNIALNLGVATYIRFWRDPKDQLEQAMIWKTLFKRIVAAMDIRFGTMYEFSVIYDVLLMVARLTLVRRNHVDARLKPVTIDEFIGHIFRVRLGPAQRQRIAERLGVADAPVAATA